MQDNVTSDTPRHLLTVSGPLVSERAGITDAHNHVWISPPAGVSPDAPTLQNVAAIQQELIDYRGAGGRTIVDCQPGGCGRDGRVLARLSNKTDVNIVAATGFHLQKYYPLDYWLFTTSAEEAKRYFLRELTVSLEETRDEDVPVRAGFIKIACEETIEKSPTALLEAAAQAAIESGAGIEIHTERGAAAERIVDHLLISGVSHNKIVLCHMDKRPDYDLHSTLAKEGVMLEYDTFFRPKYLPEEFVWPLLERMLDAGLSRQIALATDMATEDMWSSMGKGSGLKSFITTIVRRLEGLGAQKEMIQGLVGQNISDCLARPCCLTT